MDDLSPHQFFLSIVSLIKKMSIFSEKDLKNKESNVKFSIATEIFFCLKEDSWLFLDNPEPSMNNQYDAFHKPSNLSKETDFSKNDLRYLPRWRVANRVKYVVQEGLTTEEGETRDLSCSGVCLKLSRLLLPGQNVKMKIYLQSKKAVEVEGTVVWNYLAPDCRLAGISFDNPSIKSQEMILNYAFKRTR
jgi:hypothetical protein